MPYGSAHPKQCFVQKKKYRRILTLARLRKLGSEQAMGLIYSLASSWNVYPVLAELSGLYSNVYTTSKSYVHRLRNLETVAVSEVHTRLPDCVPFIIHSLL